jgi:hypothetical protein
MIGFNSGLLGLRRVPAFGGAIGVWVLNEQVLARRAGIWPVVGGFGIEPVDFALSATPVATTLGVYIVDTLNSSATLQLLVTPVEIL